MIRNNGIFSNRLLGYRASSSIYGRPIAKAYGQVRLAPNVIWTGGWTAQPADGTKGSKGKGGITQYQYITNVIFGLCEGPVNGVFSIWQDKDKFNLAYATETCSGVTAYTTIHGGTGHPEWWVLNISVARQDTVNSFSVTDYGSPASVTIPTTQVWTPMDIVATSPAAGQYALSTDSSGFAHYGFSSADASSGKAIRIQYAYQINDFSIQGSPMAHLNLVLFTGLVGQEPWNYVQNTPLFASQAIGYSELAYIGCPALDLGSAGVIPSLNFEVLGRFGPPDVISGSGSAGVDCNPADIIRDILTNPLDGALGWATSFTSTTPTQPVLTQISGTCHIIAALGIYPGNGHAIVFDTGTTAELSVGQQIVIHANVTTILQIVDSTHIVTNDPIYTTAVTAIWPWSAWVMGTPGTDQVVGSSVWLPANSAANGIGSGGQVYKYCAANGIFVSLLLDSQTDARETINRLLAIANSDAFWSEGLLKFGCYGDTTTVGTTGAVPGTGPVTYSPQTAPVYDIDDFDFISESDPPVNQNIPDVLDVKNEVSVEWVNRSADYATNTLPPSQDASMVAKYGRRPDNARAFHEITTQPVALTVQSTILKRLCYVDGAGTIKLKLPPHYALLEPMDLLQVTDLYLGWNLRPWRIIEIEEDEKAGLTFTFEPFPWSVSGPTLFPSQQHSPTQAGYFASPGHVNDPLFISLPEEITQGNPYVVGIALSGGPNWGGSAVFMSPDPSGPFTFVGMATSPATMGYLTAALPVGPDPDTTDTLSVSLTESFGTIETPYVTPPAPSTFLADSFQSLIAVDSELLAFETVTQTDTYQFDLTYLRRGVYDTTISAHAIGGQFCQVLGANLFQFNYGASNVGKTLYFKFCSVNQAGANQEDLSQVTAYPWAVPTPRPPWPLNAGWVAPLSGDAMFIADTIGVAQVYPTGETQNGLPSPAIQVYGNPPLNVPTALVGPPTIVSVSYTSTGGSIVGGVTYLIAVNSFDAATSPNQSFLSGAVAVALPVGAATYQLTITVDWPAGSFGGDVYVAKTNDAKGYHLETAFGAGSPTSGAVAYTLSAITGVGMGPPDNQFDHFFYRVLREFVSGPFNQTCASISTNTIAFGGVTTAGAFVGRVLSKMADVMVASPGQIPFQNYVITANDTAGNCTVTPDPAANGCVAGDIFSLRTGSGISGVTVANPLTAGNSGGQGYFIDPLMTNPYNLGGLLKHGNGGNLAAVISGTGAGQPYVTVIDNNGPVDTPANKVFTTEWAIEPDETSVIVLLEAQPQVILPGDPLTMPNYVSWQGMLAALPVPNYAGQVVRVEVYTADSGGFTGPQNTVAFREAYVEGAQGTSFVSASTTQLPTQATVQFITTSVTGTTTTLNGSILSGATSLVLNTAYAPPDGTYFTIDSETFVCHSGTGTTGLAVTGGQLGTTPANHSNGATVHVPGALTFTLLPISQVPNQPFWGHKNTSDINYVKVVTALGKTWYLVDTTDQNGTIALKAPGE